MAKLFRRFGDLLRGRRVKGDAAIIPPVYSTPPAPQPAAPRVAAATLPEAPRSAEPGLLREPAIPLEPAVPREPRVPGP